MVSKKGKGENIIKENQDLFELAVNCKFIAKENEKEILPRLFQFSKQNPEKSIVRFFIKNNILSENKLKLLVAIKKHVDMLMQDKKFGNLGVANQFVSRENVQKALDIQVAIFRKKKKSIKIGDILENNNDISKENKTAILLTQDRIRDEFLAEALNTLATSEIEKININKRFGAIAVKKELITTRQLNQALKQQQKEEERGNRKYLGEILKDLFNISDKQVLTILKIQRKFETRRLHLEQNLIQYNSEKETNETLDQYFEYHVSEDKLEAYVTKIKQVSHDIKATEFLNWLSLTGITSGLCSEIELETALRDLKIGEKFKIAQGRAPSEGRQAFVDYLFDAGFCASEEADLKKAPMVKKEDVLARISVSEKGQPGKDVFGHPINLSDSPDLTLNCGEGVKKRGNDFIAAIDGHPKLYKHRTLFVTPAEQTLKTKKIEGDITSDFNDPSAVLIVNGDIANNTSVFCYQLTIEGNIYGNVTAADSIEVGGQIGFELNGRDGSAEQVHVNAKGSIQAGRDIVDAVIVADKGLTASNSDFRSSQIVSGGNITVKNIHSTEKMPSVLRIAQENYFEINKIDIAIKEKNKEYDKLSYAKQLALLDNELTEQIQVQNRYLEKQAVISLLKKVLNDPETAAIKSLSRKVAAYTRKMDDSSGSANNGSILQNAKNHVFLDKIFKKIGTLKLEDQKKSVQELYHNISGMYKAAVKVTERVKKKNDARIKSIHHTVVQAEPEIQRIEKEIETLNIQKDFLMLNRENAVSAAPIVKVKNQIEKSTVIRGETAELVVEKSIYGVTLKENKSLLKGGPKIKIEGYFD